MPGWLTYQAVLPKMDKRIYTGRVQLLERKGISVISDIDDTIKVSEVTNPDSKIFLRNTFINEYQAVEDMANLYRQWENAGMQFHYVSANPWQLYDTINKFMESAGFPKGSMRLRNFRWKDFRSLEQLFSSLVTFKLSITEDILHRVPERKFILVGDSGQSDPEIYAELYCKHPNQILHICIRDVQGEGVDFDRFRRACKDIPETKWTVFREANELKRVRHQS
ncbi:MAG: hypothetical protein XU11_C0057G0002 [Candidatus Dadabacteria bacterium CSP1-2]|nr:MAG: hypothetical protein XU11_C0057G0002 [Candidatus Dadabacteria bacterium CSP1-2]HJZ04258.1 phosphatase domain-containing protein [Patescibacteria group bacterium]